MLGESVPSQGIFFATYVCIQTGITTSLELLNPVRLVFVFLFKKMAKTERQKRMAQANGCDPVMFRKYGSAMLISFIGIMYMPMAPLLPILCSIFFGYVYIVHRYNLIYNLYSVTDGAGESYPGAFWGTLLALTLRQGVLIVMLGAKQSTASPFVIVPLILTICTGIEIGRRFRRVAMFGSLHDHMADKTDDIPDRFLEIYEQPSLKRGMSYARPGDYLNLNGVAEIDDYHENSREIPPDFELKTAESPVEPSDAVNTADAVVDSTRSSATDDGPISFPPHLASLCPRWEACAKKLPPFSLALQNTYRQTASGSRSANGLPPPSVARVRKTAVGSLRPVEAANGQQHCILQTLLAINSIPVTCCAAARPPLPTMRASRCCAAASHRTDTRSKRAHLQTSAQVLATATTAFYLLLFTIICLEIASSSSIICAFVLPIMQYCA
eukprot:IDg8615t1